MNRLGKISLMLFALSICATAGLLSHLHSLEKDALDPQDIYAAVSAQFESFKEANYIQAYDHASSTIQVRFNLDEFENMARAYYPVVTKAERVEFGTMQRTRHGIQLRVYFIEKNNQATACLYSLVPEQGRWKIEGVEILNEWPKGSRLSGLRI